MIGNEELQTRFTYHPPRDGQADKYALLRQAAFDFARKIDSAAPDSREKSLAVTCLEEAVMWANAAIARREIPA